MTDHLDLLQVRVIVTDAEVLGRLDPAAVAVYLAHAGWTRARERRTGTVWTRQLDDSVASVFLPGDQTYADFPIRMGELLAALAFVEDRSQLAVLADLYDRMAADTQQGDRRRHAVGCVASRRHWYWPRDQETFSCTCGADDVAQACGRLAEAITEAQCGGRDVLLTVEDALALLNGMTKEPLQ
jgi:hypothetical protein